jgi:hypothetical protein
MIKKVKLVKVSVADSKFGSDEPYVYKSGPNMGKHFQRITIQTDQTGDDYYNSNGLPGSKITQLKEGDEVILNFTETPSTDGQTTFKNFGFPSKDALAELAAKSL